MDPATTLINGQPVPREVKELATTADGGVNTAAVAFFHADFVRTAERDTQIRPAPPPDLHDADTLIVAAPQG